MISCNSLDASTQGELPNRLVRGHLGGFFLSRSSSRWAQPLKERLRFVIWVYYTSALDLAHSDCRECTRTLTTNLRQVTRHGVLDECRLAPGHSKAASSISRDSVSGLKRTSIHFSLKMVRGSVKTIGGLRLNLPHGIAHSLPPTAPRLRQLPDHRRSRGANARGAPCGTR